MGGERRGDRIFLGVFRLAMWFLPRRFRERRSAELEWTFEQRLRDSAGAASGRRMMWLLREVSGVMLAGLSSRRTGGESRSAFDGRRGRTGFGGMLVRDASMSVRTLRRAPGFTVVVILILALGIGASVAIFSAVDAVLLRPLPLPDADRLVAMWESNRERGWVRGQVAPANYLDWIERLPVFEGIAGYNDYLSAYELGGTGEPRRVLANEVTGNFFRVLGVAPVLGRSFTDEETWAGSAPVVVVSWSMWQELFDGDPGVIGRTIQLDRNPVTVIGVMPQSLRFPREETQLWSTVGWNREARTQDWFRRAHLLRVVGRLARGEPIERANERLAELGLALQREYPGLNRGMEHGLSPLREYLSASSRTPLYILLGAVTLLLLTACANVGNLVLVRGLARGRELAVRGALGASRRRVVAQLVTENTVLAVLGGGLGLVLGAWGTRLIARYRPAGIETWEPIAVDGRVVMFALAATLLTAVLFGVLPAWRSARTNLTSSLRDAARTTAGVSPTRISNALVMAELALALVLVLGAGLLTRSFMRLRDVDAGVDTSNVLTARVSLPGADYDSRARVLAFWSTLIERIRGLPGVEVAGGVTRLPLTVSNWSSDFTAEGWGPDRFGSEVVHREIMPGYLESLRVPLLRGRMLDDGDDGRPTDPGVLRNNTVAGGSTVQTAPGVLINEALARRYFSDEDPIGRRITFDRVAGPTSYWRTIVGVVGSERQRGLDAEPLPEFLAPLSVDWNRHLTLTIRTRGDAAALAPAVLELVRTMDAALPVYSVRTMDDVRDASLARIRFLIVLFGLFASIALVLAVVGVYGVAAQAAKARTQEIGIRMALGARSGDVQRMMLRRGLLLMAGGLGLGGIAALAGSRILSSLLYGIEPTDPVTFTAVILILGGTAALASWIPARLAARTDPVKALRNS